MEITKREIIFSSIIISVMLIIGLMLSDKISDSITDRNEIYNKAIHIEDKELFEYGMRTSIGNAFVYGDLVAIDTVSYPEVDGDYLYIEKVKERYTQHSRIVSYKCGKRTCTRTQIYWTWDKVGSEEKKSEKVTFLDVEFNFNQFLTPSAEYLTTIKESSRIRYKYYVVPNKVTGTIFTNLRDKDIGEKNLIRINMTSEETYNHLTTGKWSLWLFWVIWVSVIGFIVYYFYRLKNKWLY